MTVVDGTDLRLVPAALLTWVACLVAVGLGARAALLVGATLGAAAVVVGLLARRAVAARGREDHVVLTVALALTAAAIGCTVTSVQTAARESGALAGLAGESAQVVLEGRVVGDAVPVGRWGEQYRVRLRVHGVRSPAPAPAPASSAPASSAPAPAAAPSAPAAADVLVTGSGDGWAPVRHGSLLQVSGHLTRAARADDVLATLRAAGPPAVVEAPGRGAALVGRLREGLLEVTEDLAADHRGLVVGAAIGATDAIPDELRQAMRDAGLTHVTAVSGAHFAVVAVAVLAVTGALRAPPALRATVLAGAAVAFVHLVHGGASVARAGAAAAVWALALLLRRPARAVPALAGGVVVLLLVDPWLSRSFGFVLSAGATAAIVLLAPALVARRPAAVPRPVATVVAVPLAAQLVCGPVLVLLDPVLTTYAVPANLLAAPALLPATLLGLVTTLLSPVAPGVAEGVAALAAVPAAWVGAVARTTAALPGARLPWWPGVPGATALACLTVTVLAVVLRRAPRHA